MLELMLSMIVVTFMWSCQFTNGYESIKKYISVNQYDAVRLDCYSGYDESADWYFHDRFGDTIPIYSSGYLQPQEKMKYRITSDSDFYNLTIFNVSFEDIGRYECREGWGVGGRPRHNFEISVTDIDECSTWNVCDENANCTNTHGSFNCTCRNGFSGNGFECKDENECYSAPCGANAICQNLPGSYVCTCYHNLVYLQFVNGCTVIHEMHVIMGESRQLKCQTFPNAPIEWLFMATDSSSGVHLYLNNQIVDTTRNIPENIMKPEDGDYSLTLNEVKPIETGYYVCINEKDGTKRGYFLNISAAAERSNVSIGSYNEPQQRLKVIAIISAGIGSVIVVALFGLIAYGMWIKKRRERRSSQSATMKELVPATTSVSVTHVIAASDDRNYDVAGVTIYGGELYIVHLQPRGQIEVYTATNMAFNRTINVEELGVSKMHVHGLTSCDRNHCLYVSCWHNYIDGYIVRVNLTGNREVVKWKVKDENYMPQGLSVNSKHNLLVTCWRWSRLNGWSLASWIEYTTRGLFLREISLQDDVVFPHHTLQLNSCELLVSHGGQSTLHRVCVVDESGLVLRSCGSEPGSGTGLWNHPRHLAVDGNGLIFVADRDNDRLVILDSGLKWSRDLQIDGGRVKRPCCLYLEEKDCVNRFCCVYLDEQRYPLYVGECGNSDSQVVLIKV